MENPASYLTASIPIEILYELRDHIKREIREGGHDLDITRIKGWIERRERRNRIEQDQLLMEDLGRRIQQHKDVKEATDNVHEWMRERLQAQVRITYGLKYNDDAVRYWHNAADIIARWLALDKAELAKVEQFITEREKLDNEGLDGRTVKKRGY